MLVRGRFGGGAGPAARLQQRGRHRGEVVRVPKGAQRHLQRGQRGGVVGHLLALRRRQQRGDNLRAHGGDGSQWSRGRPRWVGHVDEAARQWGRQRRNSAGGGFLAAQKLRQDSGFSVMLTNR